MARGRMISKSLSTSEKFASLVTIAKELAEFCQVLYPLIVPHTDDFGRLQGDPFTVKHMCFPASPRSLQEFAAALAHLHTTGLIVWYTVAGKRYVQIENFDPHQLGLHKRTRSAFPRVPGNSGNEREHSATVPELPAQEKGTKGNRTQRNNPPTPLRGGRRRGGASKVGRDDSRLCHHEPKCSSFTACRDRIVAEGRKAAAS